ncbi:FERM and PDZ domain-containing protein 3 [Heterodontus francisci]|uniref:FERM and PDZ domain-containing protein 3 n=1 Tax=Heterodontus francisci TaxID=7792 RepID=UPI00355BECF7
MMSDNGPQVMSKGFRHFTNDREIQHYTSSPHYPPSNRKAEAAVKIAKRIIKKSTRSGTDVYKAIFEWKNTPTEGMVSNLVQRLMSQCTQMTLPIAKKLLKPEVLTSARDKITVKQQKGRNFILAAGVSTSGETDTEICALPPFRRGGNCCWRPRSISGARSQCKADYDATGSANYCCSCNRCHVMHAVSLNDMECDHLSALPTRQVKIKRDPVYGFGFVAGSEKPVIVRAVSPGGPSEGRLIPGDQILAINDEGVSTAPRERVIDLVRNGKDSIILTVLQPHQSPKSAFISAAKKAQLRTNPVKVRFSEEVTINGNSSDHMKEETLMLISNVLNVYLENGQMKSFTFDSRTTVRDVILTLQDRLSLRCIEHFALVLEVGNEGPEKKLLLLHEAETLIQVVQRSHFNTMKCILRITFFPKDPVDLLRRDPVAFDYLYAQSCSDVMKERFSGDLADDVMLQLTALHIYITVSNARTNQKITLRNVEKEWGLEMFLPSSLLLYMKEKHRRKILAHHLKATQAPGPSGKKISAIQAKLQYLRILNELPLYPGGLFNSVVLDAKHSEMTLLVGPQHGISHVIDLKTNLTTILAEFGRVSRIQLFREKENVARVELTISEAKPIVLLMESTEAVNFACLIAGYYRLFIDAKKMIFCSANVQPQVNKADYRNIPNILQPEWTISSSGPVLKTEGRGASCPRNLPHHNESKIPCNLMANSPESNLVRFHFLQMQERRKEFENQIDINENLIFFEESRPRTKSDPTPNTSKAGQSNSDIRSGSGHQGFLSRGRANTLDSQLKMENDDLLCDACKVKMKGNIIPKRSSTEKSLNPCNYRDDVVDLTTLPLPGSDEEHEGDECHSLLPTLAAPPPGFRDNSSDEDDSKRRTNQSLTSSQQPCEILFNDIPVSLIDGVKTRTVRHRAQELDDALVSTLQALEALAAAEECPRSQPQEGSGLIVLAAMTPESSLDSGHETNSSEMTDISEMVSAIKQHHLLAYQGNKAGLIMKKDVPLSAVRCCAQAAFRGVPCPKRHCEEANTLSAVASSKQSPLSSSIRLKPGNVTGYCTVHMRPQVFTHSNETINRPDNIILKPVLQQSCPSCPKIVEENMYKQQTVQSKGDFSKKLKSFCPEEITIQSEDKSFLHVGGDRTCIKQLLNGRNCGNSPRISKPETNQENLFSCGSTNNTPPISSYTDSCVECDASKSEHLKYEGSSRPCECHLLKTEVPVQRQVDSQGHRTTVFHTCTPKNNEVAYVKVSNRKYQPATGKEISALFNKDLIDLVDVPAGHKNDYIKTEKESQPKRTGSPSRECYLSPYKYPIATLGLDNNTAQQDSTEKMKRQGHTCSCKTNISSEKTIGIPICSNPSSLSGVTLTHVTSSPAFENVFDAKQHTSLIPDKAKTQKGSLLNFKNLFSATFPARFKKESDERQEQLQKVKQYELEFLEELLKPKTKVDVFAEDYLYRIASGHCPCQIKSSPVGNIPGLSREQRRSCDCKRRGLACSSMCFPSIPSTIELQKAERAKGSCVHKQPKTSVVPSASDISTKQKATRRRTSSLESSDYRSEQQPGAFCMMGRGDCLKMPLGRKLERYHSATNIVSEVEINEIISECSENSTNMAISKAEESRNLEKGSEFIRKVLKNQCQEPDQFDDPSYAHISNTDKKQRSPAIFSIQGEFKPSRSVPLLKGDMASNNRCCSFRYCFYYRNCDVADDSSDKDELSYSVPMQLLPDLRSDSSVTLSETLAKPYQMSDKNVSNGSGDNVQQEAILSDTDSNITRINALRNRAYMLPDGFIAAQQDTSELLSILRQCTANRENHSPKLYMSHLDEYKQTLTLKFKELRTACRRVAAVDKSPSRMLAAISTSFQVLCGLIETFVCLVYIVRSERQCRELLSKVEEVVVNYTFLLRAAEESSSKTSAHHLTKQSTSVATVVSTFTRSIKTLMNK